MFCKVKDFLLSSILMLVCNLQFIIILLIKSYLFLLTHQLNVLFSYNHSWCTILVNSLFYHDDCARHGHNGLAFL